MNKNFEALKRKSLISAIIKSVSAGLSAGLVTVGIVLLAVTLSGNGIHWGFYLLIGFVCAVAVGGSVFVYLLPTDKKVAKKYDNEFNLKEKLQTMVEYAGQDGDIINLQRQDACEVLSTIPKSKIQLSRIWQYVVCAVLALCVFASGVTVTVIAQTAGENNPWNKVETPPDDDPDVDPDEFDYDLFKEAGLSGLIEDVRDSALADSEKNAIIDRLYSLSEELTGITSKAEMKEIVTAAIEDVDAIINAVNSFRAISEGITETDEKLSAAIIDGVLVYKSSATQLNTADRVKSFRNRITESIEIAMEASIAESFAALKVKQVPDDPDEPTLVAVLAEYIDGLKKVVENYEASLAVAYVDETVKTDLLVTAIKSFISELELVPVDRGYTNNAIWGTDDSGNPLDSAKNNIRKAYDNLSVNLTTALSEQCYNCAMDTFVRLRLCEIFELSSGELPEFNGDLTSSGNQGGSDGDVGAEPPNGSGGIGSGETNYGGNDKIYDIDYVGSDPDADPSTDGYVHYGDVLDKYQAILYGKLENMEISEEMMKVIENYFKNLYYSGGDGTDQNEN